MLKLQQIVALYNEDQKQEALYGLDMFGNVYWYRDAQFDQATEVQVKTAGWVPLVMELSKVVEPPTTEETNANEQLGDSTIPIK